MRAGPSAPAHDLVLVYVGHYQGGGEMHPETLVGAAAVIGEMALRATGPGDVVGGQLALDPIVSCARLAPLREDHEIHRRFAAA